MMNMGISSRKTAWAFIPLMAFAIVMTCSLFFNDFFFIDDAQNENLPFYKEMGRIWLSGHVPILTTNTMIGGNILVDMVLSPFAPQVILSSILAAKTSSFLLVANTLAWINISLVISGVYWLSQLLKMRPAYGLLAGFLVATNPVFLYVFQASWWNLATAFAWFVTGFAALMAFRQNPSRTNFILSIATGCFLFASAGTQAQFIYLVFVSILIIYDSCFKKNLPLAIWLIVISLCVGLLSAIPIISEYFISSSLIDRPSGFFNSGNFLVPNFQQIVNLFNPLLSGYMHWFWSYRYIPVSLGYIGIVTLLPLFFINWASIQPYQRGLWLTLGFVTLLLLFTSQHTGPLRWPFRYLPVWSLIVTVFCLYALDKGTWIITPTRTKLFWLAVVFSGWLQLFSAENDVFILNRIIWLLTFLGLCFILFFFSRKEKQNVAAFILISIAAWVTMLAKTSSLTTHLAYDKLETVINIPINKHEKSFNATQTFPNRPVKDVSDLLSGQFLLHGLPAINGYSPVGHKGIAVLLPHTYARGNFDPITSIHNLFSDVHGKPLYQVLGISHIFIEKVSLTESLYKNVDRYGLLIKPINNSDRLHITTDQPLIENGSLGFQSSNDIGVQFKRSNGPRKEWYQVDHSSASRTLVFSRVFWHGYRAKLNGKDLPVTAFKETLVQLELPPNASGKLKIWYEPVSWQWTRWSILLGTITVIAGLWLLGRKKDVVN
jgi:hypothetical protein